MYFSITYILIGLFALGRTELFPCERILNNRICYVENITIEADADHRRAQFQDILQMVIEHSQIPVFSANLLASLGESNFLTLKGGNISMVNFSSDSLNSLRIDKTGLRNFTVHPVTNYNLNTLMINRNPLKSLPSTVQYLVGLSILDLSQNHLEFVNLDWFKDMYNLLVLDLSWNHLSTIDGSSGLQMNRLKNFWVSHNHLSQIPWFPIGFPKLERVRLAANHWSCAWVGSLRQQIWNRRIRLFDSDAACEENEEGGLCCYSTVPPLPQTRYEVIEIEVAPRQNENVQEKLQQEPLEGLTRTTTETTNAALDQQQDADNCRVLEGKVRLLQRENLMLAKEKTEMEQQFAKKVATMQDILRAVREDLDESEREVSRYRYKERLEMIASTSSVHS